jgi:hypothetical protein
LQLLWNSTFSRVLAAFLGVRSFFLLPKPIWLTFATKTYW